MNWQVNSCAIEEGTLFLAVGYLSSRFLHQLIVFSHIYLITSLGWSYMIYKIITSNVPSTFKNLWFLIYLKKHLLAPVGYRPTYKTKQKQAR